MFKQLTRRQLPMIYWLAACLMLAIGAAPARAAVITVNSSLDMIDNTDSLCTLREAVFAANFNTAFSGCNAGSGTAEDTIVFSAAVFPTPLQIAAIALNGSLIIGDNSLHISVDSGFSLFLIGDGSEPVIDLRQDVGATFTMSRLILNSGFNDEPGGAITIKQGTRFVNINGGIIQGSESLGNGGAIGIVSPDPVTINLDGVTLRNNQAGGDGGAIGGLLNNNATINLTDCHLHGNQAGGAGGALFLRPATGVGNTSAFIIAEGTRFIDNTANGEGGAINLSVASNSTNQGAVQLRDSAVVGNRSVTAGGGGVSVSGSTASITGNVIIRRTSFIDNQAVVTGGAIRVGGMNTALVNNSFINNSSDRIGGVSLFLSSLTEAVDVNLIGNTFYRNNGGLAGGSVTGVDLGISFPTSSGSVVRYRGNLFESIAASPNFPCRFTSVTAAATLLGGWNLTQAAVFPESCSLTANDAEVDDLQLSLEVLGDPVHQQAVIPGVGSAAIDAWPDNSCVDANGAALALDMIGERRIGGTPVNGNPFTQPACDSGAIEAPPAQGLTVTRSGSGSGTVSSQPAGIDCGSDCSAIYATGAEVSLTATSDPNAMFVGWSGDCSGAGACVVNMTQLRTVDAEFEFVPNSFPLTVTLQGTGAGSVSSMPSGIQCPGQCTADFVENTTVTLTATAGADSTFSAWGGDCAGAGSGPCVLSITEVSSVTARFEPLGERLQVNLEGEGSGAVISMPAGINCPGNCDAFFPTNSMVTLEAIADAGFVFQGWSGACSGVVCIVDMDQDYAVRAVFVAMDTLFYDSFE
ncbi:MAG: hypothetical protein Tsb002_36170 [Wenzhouxiangellaceae bacterium]